MTIDTLLPLACKWSEEQERHILAEGVPLNDSQVQDALKIGVARPEEVRILRVDTIPSPKDPVLQAASSRVGLNWSNTSGLTLRYGIFIRSNYWSDRRLIAHELTHAMQYGRFGSRAAFLREWIGECLQHAYGNGPLEREAQKMANQLYP